MFMSISGSESTGGSADPSLKGPVKGGRSFEPSRCKTIMFGGGLSTNSPGEQVVVLKPRVGLLRL